MRFPLKIRHRRAEARIYGRSRNYPYYRVAYYAAGKRHIHHFSAYRQAKAEAERIVRQLAAGSQAVALTACQANDALAALERLESLRQSTGKRISLLRAASDYADAAARLNGYTLGEAIERFLGTVAAVKSKAVGEAVEDFIRAEEPRTRADDGQRPQLSERYTYTRDIRLRRFARAFPNTNVCDLTKAHLDSFMGLLIKLSPKSRNHYRATVRQFLRWATRRDYLPQGQRLDEADGLRVEHATPGEVVFYTPKELRAMLEAAQGPARAMIALGGLAGLRTAELLRLDWADVWRAPAISRSRLARQRLANAGWWKSAPRWLRGWNRSAHRPAASFGKRPKTSS